MKQKYCWTEFRKLKRNERFWLGTADALKVNFFSAWRGGMRVFVSPFRKVRTRRPYGPVAPQVVGHIAKMLAANAPYLAVIKTPAARTEPVEGSVE